PAATAPVTPPPVTPAPLLEPVIETAPAASASPAASAALAAAPVPAAAPPAASSPVFAVADASLTRPRPPVTVAPPAPSQLPSATPTPTPQYTGEIVSFDLVNYDIKDFFRLISEISGLNVVLDPNVGGVVTLRLIDVPWDQALDVVLRNYQLG